MTTARQTWISRVGIAAVGIACIAWLGGCSKLREGEVFEHGHRPAQETMILMPIVRSTGKTCTTTMVPVWFFYPERWYVSIKAYDGKKWRTSTYWVSEGTYSKVRDGMWFCTTPDCQSSEPRIKEEK